MKIQEMFDELGLMPETVSQLIADIQLHNFQQPENSIPVISLNADIDTIMLSQTPMIGRAIAKERGREYLDQEKQFPLVFESNAMRYGSFEIAKFYNAEHLFK